MSMQCECWRNPETGYFEACAEHEPIFMDYMQIVESLRAENAELKASSARLREAAAEMTEQLRQLDLYELNDNNDFNNAVMELREVSRESPAVNLAAKEPA